MLVRRFSMMASAGFGTVSLWFLLVVVSAQISPHEEHEGGGECSHSLLQSSTRKNASVIVLDSAPSIDVAKVGSGSVSSTLSEASSMTWRCFVVTGAATLIALCVVCFRAHLEAAGSSIFGQALETVSESPAERLFLLDNAKVCAQCLVVFNHFLYYTEVGEYVDGKTWLSGSEPLLKALMYGIRMVMMPAICFISGVCSQGAVTEQKRERYVQYLVAPTLLWVCFAKPVIVDSLMTMQPQTLMAQLHALVSLQAFHEEWYLQALTIWRGLVYLLWAKIHPIVAFVSMMVLSCGAGYFNLSSGPAYFLKLSEVLGFLPYFAIGYVFPFQAACRVVPRPRNAISVLVVGLVFVWVAFLVPALFPESLPDGHGSYHCCDAHKTFAKASGWDLRLYWARRFAKTVVELPPMLALLFLVLPRGSMPMTWAGPHTLYPFLFHLLGHSWRSRLMARLPLPIVTSFGGHLLVLALQIPYCVALIAFFASSFWRRLFGWCLSPSWLEPIMVSDACAKRADISSMKAMAAQAG